MERKALERLVSALIDDEHSENRVEQIENALYYAQIALWGEGELDEEEIQHALDSLSVQLMAEKLSREDLSIYRASVMGTIDENPEGEVAQIIATTNPLVGSIIDHTVGQFLTQPEPYDVN